jgi:hypothetical protein
MDTGAATGKTARDASQVAHPNVFGGSVSRFAHALSRWRRDL